MKVIFLDVDGVLNSTKFAIETFQEYGVRVFAENMLDRKALTLLWRLVSETGAVIVLSSTWRKYAPDRESLADQLDYYGLSLHSDTPNLGTTRGKEISAWLSEHGDVEQYVILDDDSDMDEHMDHLVQTTFERGLEKKHFYAALRLLTSN